MNESTPETGGSDGAPVRYRGSRKHVLDWTQQPTFLKEVVELLSPCPFDVDADTRFMPQGYEAPDEARLERFGPTWLPACSAWASLQNWWLRHQSQANTPNWDVVVTGQLANRPAIVLIEAKAHWSESKVEGKGSANQHSPKSQDNHEQIGRAIAEANKGWQTIDRRVRITRDSHYQLANRMAFSWKLATLGIPTALVYLGFIGDNGIRDAGKPFESPEHWREAFREYAGPVVPLDLFERSHVFGSTEVWLMLRSRPVIWPSPPR